MNKIIQFFAIRLKRLLFAILWQIPWFSLFSGGIWYAKTHLNIYLTTAFDLSIYEERAIFLQKRTDIIYNTLSVMNPLKYTDYLSALSVSTFANARVATIRQTIRLLESLLGGCLHILFIIGCLCLISRIFKYYREKTREENMVNAIVAKLKPILIALKKEI